MSPTCGCQSVIPKAGKRPPEKTMLKPRLRTLLGGQNFSDLIAVVYRLLEPAEPVVLRRAIG
jgi:hypothetical protein